ncbi:hypothetical protein AB3S75_017361 [Citrus x aurantiifolia]
MLIWTNPRIDPAKSMTEQREEGIRENCIKVLTGEPELDEVAFCLEEKKAEAENSAEDKKNEQNNYGFISYSYICPST